MFQVLQGKALGKRGQRRSMRVVIYLHIVWPDGSYQGYSNGQLLFATDADAIQVARATDRWRRCGQILNYIVNNLGHHIGIFAYYLVNSMQ